MNRRKLNLIALLSLALTACEKPKLTALSESEVIVAFGDSLTEGVGTHGDSAYPTILAEISQRRVVNAGISGETTAEGVRRFENVLDKYQPALVVLLEGGNDILRNLDQEQTRQNLAQMIGQAQQRNVQILLICVPAKKFFSNCADLYRELAAEFDVPLDEESLARLLRTPALKSDPIHLNRAGYEQLAQAVAQRLRDEGALP